MGMRRVLRSWAKRDQQGDVLQEAQEHKESVTVTDSKGVLR